MSRWPRHRALPPTAAANPSHPPSAPCSCQGRGESLIDPRVSIPDQSPQISPQGWGGGVGGVLVVVAGEQVATDISPTWCVLITAGAACRAASQASGRSFSPSCRGRFPRKMQPGCERLNLCVWGFLLWGWEALQVTSQAGQPSAAPCNPVK